MKFIVFRNGRKVGEFASIQGVDDQIMLDAKSFQSYDRHNESAYVFFSEGPEVARYLIMTKVFDSGGEIIEDMRHNLLIKKRIDG
jgi:hypothetical protein